MEAMFDSEAPSPLPTLVEEASTGIIDRIEDYSMDSESSASLSSELSTDSDSVLDTIVWDAHRSLPTIRIEECEDLSPSDQDLEDTCLATALSLLDLTLDHLLVSSPSGDAPDSESASQPESLLESDDDPLAMLCDILELSDDLDCSFKARTFAASGLADDWKYAFSSTAPLRISKSRR